MNLIIPSTGRERLIPSHLSARFCFELSGTYDLGTKDPVIQDFDQTVNLTYYYESTLQD